jgi:hypothetical protein
MASRISETDWNGSIAQVVQGASIEFMTSFIAEANWNIIAMPAFPRQVESRESNTSSS